MIQRLERKMEMTEIRMLAFHWEKQGWKTYETKPSTSVSVGDLGGKLGEIGLRWVGYVLQRENSM